MCATKLGLGASSRSSKKGSHSPGSGHQVQLELHSQWLHLVRSAAGVRGSHAETIASNAVQEAQSTQGFKLHDRCYCMNSLRSQITHLKPEMNSIIPQANNDRLPGTQRFVGFPLNMVPDRGFGAFGCSGACGRLEGSMEEKIGKTHSIWTSGKPSRSKYFDTC